MAAPRKYPDELRERATRMAVDARRDPATRSGALKRIGEQLVLQRHFVFWPWWPRIFPACHGLLTGVSSPACAPRIVRSGRTGGEVPLQY
jgi:hypothetical protein